MDKTVRVIRTYDVTVSAEYGDDVQSLIDKAEVGPDTPYQQEAVVIPDAAGEESSPFAPNEDAPTPEEL